MGRLVIWYNPNNNTYYYKFTKGCYYNYQVGLVNQYNHIVILVIEINEFLFPRYYKVDYRKRIVSSMIRFLKKFE